MCTQSEIMNKQNPWPPLEQLLTAIRQLDEPALSRVADLVDETRLHLSLSSWLERPEALAGSHGNNLADITIEAEISAILQLSR